MSVQKSKRNVAKVQFLQDAFHARKKTLEVLKKFPKGYKFNLPSRIAELADKAYWAAFEGNAVYMHKNMSYEDFALRRQQLLKAYSSLRALTAETTFCYELAMEGENFFEDANIRDKTFSEWTSRCAAAAKSLKNILESDKKRYKRFVDDRVSKSDQIARLERAIDAAQERNKRAFVDEVKRVLL